MLHEFGVCFYSILNNVYYLALIHVALFPFGFSFEVTRVSVTTGKHLGTGVSNTL
jgi:hypothetical protein